MSTQDDSCDGADCVQFASNAIFFYNKCGCMGLVMQREIMEDMREEPFVINKDESFFWEVIFTSESLDLDSYNTLTRRQSILMIQSQKCQLPSG